MYHDVKKSVWDAIEACQAIQEFTAGHTLKNYRADIKLRYAIERSFEILGEAFNRVDDADPSFRNILPELGDIIGMRNRISHGYDRVEDKIIWDAAVTKVPPLMGKLTAWLEQNQ
jgi:uncharacterized protein with HEPN domain